MTRCAISARCSSSTCRRVVASEREEEEDSRSMVILQGGFPGFPGADTDGGAQITHEDFSISDAAGLCRPRNRFQNAGDLAVLHGHFKLDLWHELDRVLLPSIGFFVTFLTAESLDLCHRHALHTYLQQGIFDLVEFERLDDRLN